MARRHGTRQNSYNRATSGATEINKQAALRPTIGKKRAPDCDIMSPRKTVAVAKMPSPSTEKLKLEVESLRLKLQLQQSHQTNPAPLPHQHHSNFFQQHQQQQAMMAAASMWNPFMAMGSMFGGGYPQVASFNQAPAPLPFQNPVSAFQMQPTFDTSHAGHPTLPQHHPPVQHEQNLTGYAPQQLPGYQHPYGNGNWP